MTLGEALRAARMRKELSIRETAEKLRLYRGTYKRWERDAAQPRVQELPLLESVLGLRTTVDAAGKVSPA